MSGLDRFRQAQANSGSGHEAALREIRGGRKRGHWIWYVLPQLGGLGSSPNSRRFGIAGRAEAIEYLRDPELRGRLLEITRAVADRLRAGAPGSLRALMGSDIDARKVVSSLTLFARIAEELNSSDASGECAELSRIANQVLAFASAEGYPVCRATIAALAPPK